MWLKMDGLNLIREEQKLLYEHCVGIAKEKSLLCDEEGQSRADLQSCYQRIRHCCRWKLYFFNVFVCVSFMLIKDAQVRQLICCFTQLPKKLERKWRKLHSVIANLVNFRIALAIIERCLDVWLEQQQKSIATPSTQKTEKE